MTWNRKNDRYLLKFRLNFHQKMCGIPMGEDLDSELISSQQISRHHQEECSVCTCQCYDPNGLATPLMVTIRMLFREVCRDKGCSMQTHLSADRADRFRSAVTEILGTSELSFPRQIVFKNSNKLYIFLTAVYRATEPVFPSNPTTSSTCWSAQPRLWGKLPTQLHNPKSPVLSWLSRWRERLL